MEGLGWSFTLVQDFQSLGPSSGLVAVVKNQPAGSFSFGRGLSVCLEFCENNDLQTLIHMVFKSAGWVLLMVPLL